MKRIGLEIIIIYNIVMEDVEPDFTDEVSDTSSLVGSDVGDIEGGGVDVYSDVEEEEQEEESDDDAIDEEEADVEENLGENMSASGRSDDEEEEEEEEEDDDENYLQKMDDHVRRKVIENHHPELKTLNYEEVEALATVIRDANGVIIDPLHQTLPILSRYEKARALGERARQINGGAKPMVEVDPTILDGYLIALKELEEKRLPFIIQRPLPNGGSEYWRIADLEML